jgi:hypothetical protein
MKIGLSGANVGSFVRPALIAQVARDAEQFGFESVWTIEHLVVPKVHAPYHATPDGQIPGGDNLPINEPLMQLSYAAAYRFFCQLGMRDGVEYKIRPYHRRSAVYECHVVRFSHASPKRPSSSRRT